MTDPGNAGISLHPDIPALADAVADLVEAVARESIRSRGVFHFVLCGGMTPRTLYRILDRPPRWGRIDWTRTEVWFGDERCVPPDDVQSNFWMANQALLERVPLRESEVHRIRGEAEPAVAAEEYEAEIRRAFPDDLPRFDLVLLGMGTDGHTASLFPASPGLTDEEHLVVAARAPVAPEDRVTLTMKVLNAAREVAFLITGAPKADTFGWIIRDRMKGAGAKLPAALVNPTEGRLHWFVDRDAAPFLGPKG
jgi:6-phosphogluconolactonase